MKFIKKVPKMRINCQICHSKLEISFKKIENSFGEDYLYVPDAHRIYTFRCNRCRNKNIMEYKDLPEEYKEYINNLYVINVAKHM